jgi:hypothetical protein
MPIDAPHLWGEPACRDTEGCHLRITCCSVATTSNVELPSQVGGLTTLGFCCATTMPTPGREVQAEWLGTQMLVASAANPS